MQEGLQFSRLGARARAPGGIRQLTHPPTTGTDERAQQALEGEGGQHPVVGAARRKGAEKGIGK